jgi:serine/threonine protein phosphatase PrpC
MLRVADHFERTDTGRERRANEDAFYARAPLFAVADGMGGAQAGEVASGLAVEVIQQGLPEDGHSTEERLRRLVQEANARINAVAHADEGRAGMGTTLTIAHVGEEELTVAHVGDSRLYRLRDAQFERLTDDHSLVEEWVRQGRLSPEEADDHPQRSIITRALGPESAVQPDSHTWPARAGDVYLICSDGLTSMVPESEVRELLVNTTSLEAAGRALVDAANAAGGRDNITVVLFRLEEVGQGAAAADTAEHAAVPAPDTTEHAAVRAPDDAGQATAVAAPALAEARAEGGVERRRPRPPRSSAPPPPRRRRRRVPIAGLLGALVALGIVVLSGWYASQTVYFLGISDDGFVTVYRGVPYDLPAGLDLYSENYVSGVPVAELPPARRRLVTEHRLRSRDDAHEVIRQLERGELVDR